VPAEVRLSNPDPTLQVTIPDDAGAVFILVQPRDYHPTRGEANTWFLRAFIDDPDSETPSEEG
jgi:hypothetical protein